MPTDLASEDADRGSILEHFPELVVKAANESRDLDLSDPRCAPTSVACSR